MSTVATSLAYCSGRDQMVRVVRRSDVLGESTPTGDPDDPSQLVCLEYGVGCTGAICPLFQVPTAEMELRLVEAELRKRGTR